MRWTRLTGPGRLKKQRSVLEPECTGSIFAGIEAEFEIFKALYAFYSDLRACHESVGSQHDEAGFVQIAEFSVVPGVGALGILVDDHSTPTMVVI